MLNIYKYFYKLSPLKLILLGVGVPFLLNFSLHFFLEVVGWGDKFDHEGYTTTFSDFIVLVIIAPLLETLFCQFIPLKIASQFANKYKYIFCITIIIISLIFGLLHWKSPLYMIVAFFYGIIWSFCCLIFIRKKQHPILYTALIHGCYNGLLFGLTLAMDLFEI